MFLASNLEKPKENECFCSPKASGATKRHQRGCRETPERLKRGSKTPERQQRDTREAAERQQDTREAAEVLREVD